MNKKTRECLNYLEQEIYPIRKHISKIDFEIYTNCTNYKQGIVIWWYDTFNKRLEIMRISFCKQGKYYYEVSHNFKRFHSVSKLYMNEFISKLLKEVMEK